MPLDVTLRSQTWRWHLRHDQPVDEWFRARPWVNKGGVLIVQAPNDEDVTPLMLRRLVFYADCGNSDVRVVCLGIGKDGDIVAPLATWLAVGVRNERELARRLSEDLGVRPAVFLLDARNTVGVAIAAEAAASLIDLASKLDVQYTPTLVILHQRAYAPLRGRYELDRGWPMGLARSLIETSREKVWSQYVHLRIAWECGGVIDDALECASNTESQFAECDNSLEKMLNHFAIAKFESLSSDEQRAWEEYASRRDIACPSVGGQVLETDGRITPFPWLARALLLRGTTTGGALRALRGELNCRPLSEQILATCFAVESSIRGRLPTEMGAPPEEVQRYFDRFAAAGVPGRSLEAELYPALHPSPPLDAWDFASLGEVMKHVVKVEPSERRLFNQIRVLRNAAAHCHHMGWRGLLCAREVKGILL